MFHGLNKADDNSKEGQDFFFFFFINLFLTGG